MDWVGGADGAGSPVVSPLPGGEPPVEPGGWAVPEPPGPEALPPGLPPDAPPLPVPVPGPPPASPGVEGMPGVPRNTLLSATLLVAGPNPSRAKYRGARVPAGIPERSTVTASPAPRAARSPDRVTPPTRTGAAKYVSPVVCTLR